MKLRYGMLLAWVATSCASEAAPPTAQVLLYVDTDAPIAEPGWAGPAPPAGVVPPPLPLFDVLRVEVFAPGNDTPCDGCTNDFAVDAQQLRDQRASVGLVYASGRPGYRARVRLFVHAFASPTGDPDPSTTIETDLALPVLPSDGIVEQSVLLATDTVGQPTGSLDAPVSPLGAPARSVVGTWPGAARTVCDESLRTSDAQVCVPGGAFWMGAGSGALLYGVTPGWHRLVVLSPFFVDPTEVTALHYRQSGQPIDNPWSGSTLGTSYLDWCTVTLQPSARDAFPASCIPPVYARAYCTAMGGTLPTEAQFEYMASALAGLAHVWGADEATCTDAIFGRMGFGLFMAYPGYCRAASNAMGVMGGPEPPTHGARDQLSLPTGVVYDLIANLAEWVADRYQEQTEGCWSPLGVLHDPLCDQVGSGGDRPNARSADWGQDGSNLEAATRSYYPGGPDTGSEFVGFRCVYPGR